MVLKGEELQFCGVFVVIVITGHRGRLPLNALITTAAAAVHKGPTEGFAETEEEDRGDTGLKEQMNPADDIGEGPLPAEPCGHVSSHNVANSQNNAKSI